MTRSIYRHLVVSYHIVSAFTIFILCPFLLAQKGAKKALKGRGCFDSPSPLKKPHTRNDILEGGSAPSAEGLPPVGAALKLPPHHELLCYSAATTNSSVCIGVRGKVNGREADREGGLGQPTGALTRDGSDTVPQLLKGCLFL